jgi:glyoxylase-like metal-dependent hydrolase (beta-lactamase superfamily II)
MFGRVADKVWKYTGSDKSNSYFIDGEKKIFIDAGNRTDRTNIQTFLGKAVDFSAVEIVIFTHLHYDHCGNFDLFPNAEFYASAKEIEDFTQNRNDTVLDHVVADMISSKEIKPLPAELFGLKIIETPGHTRGSVCIWYPKAKALFTGDTYFSSKMQGRTDLPTSAPTQMKNSVMKLIEIQYKVLCPGHDY